MHVQDAVTAVAALTQTRNVFEFGSHRFFANRKFVLTAQALDIDEAIEADAH